MFLGQEGRAQIMTHIWLQTVDIQICMISSDFPRFVSVGTESDGGHSEVISCFENIFETLCCIHMLLWSQDCKPMKCVLVVCFIL